MLLVWHLFDGRRLTIDMGKANGGVCHIHSDFLTQHLRLAFQVIGSLYIVIQESLELKTRESQMPACCCGRHAHEDSMHLAVYGIGIDVEGIDAHRI